MWLPSSGPSRSHGNLLLLRHLEQFLEDLAILFVNDGGHFKLPLKSFNLLLEGDRELSHVLPLLHLLEELNQTKKGGRRRREGEEEEGGGGGRGRGRREGKEEEGGEGGRGRGRRKREGEEGGEGGRGRGRRKREGEEGGEGGRGRGRIGGER